MKSIYKTVPVALIVVLVLSAAMASSAFATPEWYVKTGGVFSPLTSSLAVKPTGTLTIENHHSGLETLTVTCHVAMEGTLEPGGKSTITRYNSSECKVEPCEMIETGGPAHLPWKAELSGTGTNLKNTIMSGGLGTPEVAFSCTLFGTRFSESCGINTSAKVSNQAAERVYVQEAFHEGESARTTCTPKGGAEAGQWSGTISIPAPASVEGLEIHN